MTEPMLGVVDPAQTFYVTFSEDYANKPHPRLGDLPCLPQHYLEILATTVRQAEEVAYLLIGEGDHVLHQAVGFNQADYPAGPLPCACTGAVNYPEEVISE